jgi:hypothetical protein
MVRTQNRQNVLQILSQFFAVFKFTIKNTQTLDGGGVPVIYVSNFMSEHVTLIVRMKAQI